jgi:hypothetical protein
MQVLYRAAPSVYLTTQNVRSALLPVRSSWLEWLFECRTCRSPHTSVPAVVRVVVAAGVVVHLREAADVKGAASRDAAVHDAAPPLPLQPALAVVRRHRRRSASASARACRRCDGSTRRRCSTCACKSRTRHEAAVQARHAAEVKRSCHHRRGRRRRCSVPCSGNNRRGYRERTTDVTTTYRCASRASS